MNYNWPGNIRELENVIRKFVVLRNERMIEQDLYAIDERLPSRSAELARLEGPSTDTPVSVVREAASSLDDTTPDWELVATANREAERVAITTTLKRTNWNRRQAAVMLKLDYKGLLYKIKKLSIKKEKAAPYIVKRRDPERSPTTGAPVESGLGQAKSGSAGG